ncbi:unnamed protein product, partial [Medioppia subpectinata]
MGRTRIRKGCHISLRFVRADSLEAALKDLPQEVLTKDSVTVSVDAVIYYRIWLPTIAIANVQ